MSQVNSHYSCYKLLGYDILIDSKLQPHLIGRWSSKIKNNFFLLQKLTLCLLWTLLRLLLTCDLHLSPLTTATLHSNVISHSLLSSPHFQLCRYVKAPMIAEMLNIVGFHLPEDCGHRWRSDYTSDDQVTNTPSLYIASQNTKTFLRLKQVFGLT